ncbi:hypothetical protein BJ165DRAFT_1335254 [Panaeolus papilionaceus]|nr:hypothetical protein BJ165DRAFT_1335254 [Panaeolus papilionaceus]
MLKNIVLASFVFFLNLQTVTAQFGFFENMFGGQHQQQHHQQRTSASQWAAYSDSVSCPQYLCPETLDCVTRPADCPCPNVEDIKCLIPDMDGGVEDATVVCTRGGTDCARVERLMRRGVNSKKKK